MQKKSSKRFTKCFLLRFGNRSTLQKELNCDHSKLVSCDAWCNAKDTTFIQSSWAKNMSEECWKTKKLDFAQFSQPRVIGSDFFLFYCLRHLETQVKSANKGYFEGIFFQTKVSQSSKFSKRTHVDKNTDLIRTYYFFQYRPNTDPILTHLKKIQTSAVLHSVHRCRLWESAPSDAILLFCLAFVLI